MQQDDVAAGPAGQWCDPGLMSWVRVAGRDAVRFVESFTTASVGRVADGGGCEGFFTDVRGQVICMAGLLRCGGDAGGDADGAAAAELEPAVEIFADGDVGASLAEHLERYHIREPIEIEDVSAARSTRVVFGEAGLAAVAQRATDASTVTGLQQPFTHTAVTLASDDGTTVRTRLIRCDWGGDACWLVMCAKEDEATLEQLLADAGLTKGDQACWNQACIEAGTPRLHDLLPKTLPQELARDARAICFTKGCYLGQETVARLDALGHVNRRFMGLVVAGDAAPALGAEIASDGEPIGQVSSSCFSPTLGKPVVLAILPVKSVAGDTRLTVGGVDASVVQLPVCGGE